jgi:hypothetical protein
VGRWEVNAHLDGIRTAWETSARYRLGGRDLEGKRVKGNPPVVQASLSEASGIQSVPFDAYERTPQALR